MKIVHTCLRYPPALGGVETYVKELVTRTRDITAHRDVRVLTSKLRSHGPTSELKPSLLMDDPPYVQRLHHLNTPFVAYPRLQALPYYLSHHRPDIVHAYSFWYQPADATARYAMRQNIPFIFHPIFYTNSIRRKLRWRLYRQTIGRRTFAAADVVVVISPFEQKLITRANMPVKRFELIPPGIDINEFSQPVTNPYLSYHIKGAILLSVSRIAKGKGLSNLIKAMPAIIRNIPDAQLVIVGEDFGYLTTLRQLSNRLGLTDRVHFLGRLDRPALLGAYRHADLFVHPSYYEAFGIVMAEALASNTPVIARDTSAIPYVVPHNRAGLLFNNNPELIKHTCALLKDKNRRRQLAVQGYDYVKSNFSWDLAEKKLATIYNEVGRK